MTSPVVSVQLRLALLFPLALPLLALGGSCGDPPIYSRGGADGHGGDGSVGGRPNGTGGGNATGGVQGSTGGTSTGGAASGGAGGRATGGTNSGGAGGLATGGTSTGTGGAGGRATGGTSTGGVATGGVATGGVATGGVATGGVATGGLATGGLATGGLATGGVATGGVATGGVATGGLATGGVATGGVATGGAAGGPATGGVATGGAAGGPGAGPSAEIPDAVDCSSTTVPASGLISDFNTASPGPRRWVSSNGLVGTAFAYKDNTSTGTNTTTSVSVGAAPGDLRLVGNIAANSYGGGGLVFDQCLSTGTYTKLRYTMTGTTNCPLWLQVQPFSRKPAADVPAGGCPSTATCLDYPSAQNVATTAGTVTITLSAMSNWSTAYSKEVAGLHWFFVNIGRGSACTADLHFDNITLIP